MAGTNRITPDEVWRKLQSSEEGTLLVCAYDSDEKFRQVALEGAISYGEFQSRRSSLRKEREIVFY